MAMAIYATVIISFILMLVDIIMTYNIIHQDNLSLNTIVYADVFTGSGKTTQVNIRDEILYVNLAQNLATTLKGLKPGS